MPLSFLAWAHTSTAPQATSQNHHQCGTAAISIRSEQQSVGKRSKVHGSRLVRSSVRWTFSATARFGSLRLLVICRGTFVPVRGWITVNGLCWDQTVVIRGMFAPVFISPLLYPERARLIIVFYFSSAILDGLRDFSSFDLPNGGMFCLHTDIIAARDTLARIRVMEKLGVHIALAHDATWMEEQSDAILLSLLDTKFLQDARTYLKDQKSF